MARLCSWLMAAAVAVCGVETATAQQVPADLRRAISTRDTAVARADAAVWDRLTTDDFTVVLADGTLLTKAQRLAQIRTETPGTFEPPFKEQVNQFGDVAVRRSGDVGVWVLEVWVKDAKGWRVAAVQVTSSEK